jgi:hypothetical protein
MSLVFVIIINVNGLQFPTNQTDYYSALFFFGFAQFFVLVLSIKPVCVNGHQTVQSICSVNNSMKVILLSHIGNLILKLVLFCNRVLKLKRNTLSHPSNGSVSLVAERKLLYRLVYV